MRSRLGEGVGGGGEYTAQPDLITSPFWASWSTSYVRWAFLICKVYQGGGRNYLHHGHAPHLVERLPHLPVNFLIVSCLLVYL